MRWFNNIRMAPKLIGSFVLVALLAGVVGGAGMAGMSSMQSKMDQVTRVQAPSLVDLLKVKDGIDAEMRATRGEILSTTHAKITDLAGDATHARAQVETAIAAYLALPIENAHEAVVARHLRGLLPRWHSYSVRVGHLAAANTAASKAAARTLSFGPEADTIDAMTVDLTQLLSSNQQALASGEASATAAHNSALATLVAVVLTAIVLAVGLGVVIGRSIACPLAEVQKAAKTAATVDVANLATSMKALAEGDLTVRVQTGTTPPTYHSRDEIGQTAEVVRTIIGKVQATVTAYEAARTELQELIGQVARSSTQVDSGATQLSQASEQVGQASAQIAKAIEEMARGAGEQSQSATVASNQMTELAAAVTQVAASAEAQQQAAERATITAQEGGSAVAQTITSIESVRSAVLQSAAQVAELGKRSEEVGQIVAAIDDIAEQTNLLALNAAIEAARAGEHGKGFTVVAAEVRKLAERASNETKEITQRITAIQRQVSEVVAAMEAGSTAVEQSAALGEQAGTALRGILSVVEETTAQAAAIGSAVAQMRAGAEQVSAAIESIAAVSEQSAAGAEEVSASTEEQSASVQEMAAGAQELAALATGLQEVVGRFVLEQEQPHAPTADNVRTLRAA